MRLKRFLAFVVAFAMVMSVMPVMSLTAFAESSAPALPTATVTKIDNDDYTFAVNFLLDEMSTEQLTYYGDWNADYVLTVNKDIVFNGNQGEGFNGYLAIKADALGGDWIPVPGTNVARSANEPLKVMADAIGGTATLNVVSSTLPDFNCGVFFTEEFLAANVDLNAKLELRIYNPADANESYVIGETYVFDTIPELPTATVTEIENDDLTFALNFKANEITDKQLAYYGSWLADFVLTINEDVVFNAASETSDGYLSGQYDAWSANWVNAPIKDTALAANTPLRVMEYAAAVQGYKTSPTYNDIYTNVKDFDCGVYFTPEFLAAHPDLEVTLELRMYNPANANESYAIGEKLEFEAVPALPTATVTEIENDDLTFALNFKANEITDKQLAYYGSWLADFVLTINEDVVFNAASETSDGYLSGQYDAWSTNWVNAPIKDTALAANTPLRVMEYAAAVQGYKTSPTYNDIYTNVKDFDCGVYFTPEFLAAHPNLKVTLELRMYNPANASESYSIGEKLEFDAEDVKDGLDGSGTAEDPYLIENLEDLKWFRDKVDEQAADGSTQFAGKYFLLTDDIDLAGENWNPIGSMSGDHGSFKGVFDGGNHTIKNLNVQQAGNGIGLFARTAGNAEIKNLTLENVTVKSTDNSNYVGAVVANSYASTKITNVHVTGNIDISGRGYIGGISGHGYVVMDNVSVVGEGTISSTFWCAGGILGYGGEGSTNITNAKVEGTGETGLTVTSAAGGLGAIVGMAEDNDGTQPIAGSNLSAKNVDIKTYTGAYGDGYANYALGYLYGGNPTSVLTGTLSVENVAITTSSGVEPEVNDAVASIGDAIYFDLETALNAGGEVTLLRDVTLTDGVTVNSGVTVALDLAGHTVSQTKAQTTGYQMILNDGNLTIEDSVGTGKISYTDSGNGGEYISDTIYNRGVLVINGGTIENLSSATVASNGYPHAVDTYSGLRDASVTINGGTIYCAEYSAIRMFCVSATYKADLVINDGTIKGAVDMQNGTKNAANGTLTVNGGTFETTKNANNIRFANWNGGATEYGIEAAITGGTFNGGITTKYVPAAANWNQKIITGGTYSVDPTAYVADGYVVEANEDGTYGVEADPTKLYIYDIDDLKAFRDAVNAGNTYDNVTVYLMADIDLGSEEWAPIGTKNNPFQGNFDGGNHTISNLVITGNTASNVGFFGFTNDGTTQAVIKDLTINNAKVSGRLNVGVVAGSPYTTEYSNITLTGHVEVNGMAYVGGMFGKNAYANLTDLTVDVDSASYVNAVSTENGIAYRTYVGGVVGFMGEGGITVKNVTSNINVTGDVCDVGGITGIAHYGNNFENVTCSATVTNTNEEDAADAAQTGGIAGVWHNEAGTQVTFTNCSFTGTVVAEGVAANAAIGAAYTPANNTADTSGSLVIDNETVWPGVAMIGTKMYTTLVAALADAADGDTIILLNGEHELPLFSGKELTFKGESKDGVIVNDAPDARQQGWSGSTFHFENLTAKGAMGATANYHGLANGVVKVTYKDCNVNNLRFLYATEGVSFENCTFDSGAQEHSFWTYGASNVTVTNSTFNYADRAVNCYNENDRDTFEADIFFSGCTFNYTGTDENHVGAVEINSSLTKSIDVTVDDCTATAGDAVWFISQWDGADGANTTVVVDDEKVWPKNYVAQVGTDKYETLAEAIAAVGAGDVVIDLLADATLDYNAREAYGTSETTSLTINGNGNTLTLNQKNSDWSSVGLANTDAKLVINDVTIEKTGYGDTNGAWNTHAINFTCALEMNNATVNQSMAVQAGATLNNVTINEANGYYGLWIEGNGQTVAVTGGAINATNGGRGIKIADEYVDTVKQVTLTVDGTTFNTAKKAAVLVSSTAGAKVTATNVDVANVAADSTNFVWVDEDWAGYYNNVKVTGVTKAQENEEAFPIKVYKSDVNGTVRAYFKTLDELFAAKSTQIPLSDNYIELRGDVVAENRVNVSYSNNYYYNFGTNVEGGVTMDLQYADNWNMLPHFGLGEGVTMNSPYLQVIGGDVEIAGTLNTGYLYLYGTGEGVTINETGVVNANTGDATVQVKGGTVLTVNGVLNTSTLNVWTQDANNSELIVSGANAQVNASHLHAWNGADGVSAQKVVVENGAVLTATNFQADRGSKVTVDAATLTADTLTLGYEGNIGTLTVLNGGVITNGVVLNSVDSTVAGPEGMNVTTELEGYKVVYENGVYTAVAVEYVAENTTTGEKYESLADAIADAENGDVIDIIAAGTYKLPSVSNKTFTINATVDNVVIDHKATVGMNGSDITFKNVTIECNTQMNYIGFHESAAERYENCTINGEMWTYGTVATFTDCTFNQISSNAYNLWTYGSSNVTLTKCTLNSAGKSVLVYNEGYCATDATFEGCTFIASTPVSGKAAIEIDTTLMPDGTDVVINNSTATGFAEGSVSGNTLWNDKKDQTDLSVTVDGTLVWPKVPAADITYSAYGFAISGEEGTASYRERFAIDLYDIYAKESLVIELYAEDGTLVATTTRRATDRDEESVALYPVDADATTANIVVAGRLAGSWDTEWAVAPSVAAIPYKAVVTVDGVQVDVYENIFEAEDVTAYAELPGVYKAASVTNAEGNVTYYATVAEAIAAATAGDTVTMLDNFTGDVNVNKAIVLDGNDNTITGKLNVTADGATVKNATVNNDGGNAGYINAKDVLIENCTVTGKNGFRSCYTSGTVTFKDSTITGSTYGIHFDGRAGGNIVIDNCTITGWTSFARTITNVAMKDTEFCEGNYNYIRFYQNATIENCKFNDKMAIDVANELSDITVDVTGNGAELFDAYDAYQYTVLDNGTALVTEASVTTGEDTNYYFTFEKAIAAAVDGDTVTLLADVELDESVVLDTEGTITIDGNGYSVKQAEGYADTQNGLFMLGNTGYGDAEAATHNYTIKNVVFDGVEGWSAIRAQGVTLTVDGCEFINGNYTDGQAMMRLDYTEATVKNTTVKNNTALMAISHNFNGNDSTTKLLVEECVIEGNTFNKIGAIYYVVGGGATITNSEFVGNTVNCNDNGAIIYLGFQEDCVVTGNLFKDNAVTSAATSTRVAGAIFFGYDAKVTGNVFDGNTAANAADSVLGQVCTSVYYTDIDLSGNYFDGHEPVEGVDYTVQHKTSGNACVVDNYYTTYSLDENGNVVLEGLVEGPMGTITYGYTSQSGIWGEGKSNATESYVVELYVGEDKIATASLNDVGDIIDGTYKNVTWSIPFAGSTDEYWTVEWLEAPSKDRQPTAVKLVVDGETVAENVVKMSGPDDLNKVVWEELEIFKNYVASVTDAEGNVTKYESLAAALADAVDGDTVTLLADVELDEAVTVTGEVTLDLNGKTIAGTDKTTANFGLITVNKGDLTVIDSSEECTGKITLTAENDNGWSRYSAVIANNQGTVTVEGGTIQHLGGTTMAYGIDNLTNSNIGVATLNITGGVIDSSYIAIRQFGNSTETANILTITGGTINGVNSSVFVQNPSSDSRVSAIETTVESGATLTNRVYVTGGANVEGIDVKLSTAAVDTVTGSLPEGYKFETLDGYWAIVAVDYVASVDGVQYESLQDAVDAAEGKTVTVLGNIELETPVVVTTNTTLDLAGYTVSYESTVAGEAMITNKGDLTITDSSDEEAGKIVFTYTGEADTTYGKGNYTISNGGTLKVEAGTIENATAAMKHACYTIDNNSINSAAILTIDGGFVVNNNNYAVRQIAGTNANSVTVNGGEVKGTRAVWMQLAGSDTTVAPDVTLNVTGGTLTATGESADYKLAVYSYSYGNSMENVEINVSGGTLDGDVALTGGKNKTSVETVNVTGGTINDMYSYADADTAAAAIAITGGTFGSNNAAYYAYDDGYKFVENGEGGYSVVAMDYVASVDGVQYESLQDAVDAAFTAAYAKTDFADRIGVVTLLADNADAVNVALDEAEDYARIKLVTGDYSYKGKVTLTTNGSWIVSDEAIDVESTVANTPVVKGEGNDEYGYAAMKLGVNMVNGAQVRFGTGVDESGKVAIADDKDNGSGIRFVTIVDNNETLVNFVDSADKEYTETVDGVEYRYTKGVMGVLVTAEASNKVTTIPAEHWQNDDTFTSAITNLAVSNYVRKFTARGFADIDGIRYVDNEGVTRSVYQVAAGLLKTQSADVNVEGEETYDPTEAKLVEVLNAYVNQTGIRLVVVDNKKLVPAVSGVGGAYNSEAFFTVSGTTIVGKTYSVKLTPVGENTIINMNYWNEYVRINNNNSTVKTRVTMTKNSDGTYTLTFNAEGLIKVEPIDNTETDSVYANDGFGTEDDM